MNCNDLDRWLDDGSPESGRADAMRHAGGCARCARTLEAERAVDAALRAEASAPRMEAPTGFVARVMARVEGAAAQEVQAVHAGAAARGGATYAGAAQAVPLGAMPARTPWWAAIASDPWSIVSVTLGISLALLASWHPLWLTDAAIGFAAQWTSLVSWMDVVPRIHVSRLVWVSLGVAAAPFLAWGMVVAWRRVERTLVLLGASRRASR